MRNITGYYTKKNGNTVEFNVQVPGSWQELEAHQLATALQVLHYSKADPFVRDTSLLALLFQSHWHILDNLDEEELWGLMPLIAFMLEEPPPAINVFPKLKLRKKWHYAPAQDLSNLTFGEWCFVYHAWHYYTFFKEPEYLDKLIATIYRTIAPGADEKLAVDLDVREPFDENMITLRARSLADIQGKFKLAVYAWFTAALMQVMESRPNVFPKPEPVHGSEESPAESPQLPDPSDRTWFTVFRELIGPKWGTTEQLKNTNAMFVLDGLEEKQIEYNSMKQPQAQ